MSKIMENFWKGWLESNEIKRLELIEKLGIHKVAIALKDSNSVGASFAVLLNSYFEDLSEVVKEQEVKK